MCVCLFLCSVLEGVFDGAPAGAFGAGLGVCVEADREPALQLLLPSRSARGRVVRALRLNDPDERRSRTQVLPLRLHVHRAHQHRCVCVRERDDCDVKKTTNVRNILDFLVCLCLLLM